jgi:hypothetical protein
MKTMAKNKRKGREKEAPTTGQLSLGAETLQKRNTLANIEFVINHSGVKYSDLLKKFIEPIVSSNDDFSLTKAKLTFGSMVWNMAIVREKNEKMFQETKNEIISSMTDEPEIEQLIDDLVWRKQNLFAKYKNIIADIELIQKTNSDFNLTVSSIPPPN